MWNGLQALVLQWITSGRTHEYCDKFWKRRGFKRQRRRFADEPKRTIGESDFHRQAVRKRLSHASNRAAPGEKQDDADQNERQAQAERAPSAVETQPGPERETNDPIGGEVAEHGRARIARATESSSGDGLDAIEQLKSGAGSEQKNGAVNDSLIRSVHSRDPAGKQEQHRTGAGHKASTKKNSRAAGVARRLGIMV